jgi:hypothetical protein
MIGEIAIFEDSGYIPHLPRILEEANSQWLMPYLFSTTNPSHLSRIWAKKGGLVTIDLL